MADYTININAKDNTSKQFNKINGGLAGMTAGAGKFKAALGAAGAALAAFGVASKIKGTIDEFDALAKSARTAGAAVSEDAFRGFQVLQKAMGEAGIDAATFERAMLQTTSRIQAGVEGQKSYKAITDKLGDSIRDQNGALKTGDELLTTMINALNQGKITTEDFAKVVGGRAGPLIQQQFASLNTTAEGLEATLADVEKHSNIIPLEAAENAEVFNDTVGRLGDALGKMMTEAITPLLPMLVDFSQNLLASMPAIVDKVSAAFSALQPVFGLIGTVLTEIVFPILQKVFEVLGFIAEAISPLVDAAIPALKSAFEGLKAIVESIVGFFQKVVDGLTSIGDKAKELKDGVVGTFDNMKDSVTGAVSDMTEKTKGFFSDMYEKVVGGSIVPDMVNEVIAEFQRMNQGVVTTTVQTTTTVTEEFQKVGDAIQNDFLSAMQGAFEDGKLTLSDFEGFFKQTLTRILTEALTSGSSINNALGSMFSGGFGGGGGIGSFFSSAFSSIGNFFGGFFADGGRLGANKFGIAGENGAEIITGPANITPMDQLPTKPSVVINLNTIDSRTGTEFLLENKANIENIIQRAFNRRGKEGMA